MIHALRPDDVVLGGGNAKKLTQLPQGCRLGSNANAFIGGFRMWEETEKNKVQNRNRVRSQKEKSRRREEKTPAQKIRRTSVPSRKGKSARAA